MLTQTVWLLRRRKQQQQWWWWLWWWCEGSFLEALLIPLLLQLLW